MEAPSPVGCASGGVSGTADDVAKCVVVRLYLHSNRLRGSFNSTLGLFEHLQELDLSNNSLAGPLPSRLDQLMTSGQLREVKLSQNSFSYPPPASLIAACNAKFRNFKCLGLPPHSCAAFGPKTYVVRSDKEDECLACPSRILAVLVLSVLVLSVFLGIAVYAYLINRYPEALRTWISTLSIILTHMQTVSILARIRLAWPSSAQQVMNLVLITNVNLDISAARPECAIQNPNFPSYHVYTLCVVCLPLLTLLSVSAARGVHFLHAQLRHVAPSTAERTLDDKLELFESIVFHFWLVMSWSKIFALIIAPDSGDGQTIILTRLGAGVAYGLLGLEVLLLAKYAIHTRAVMAMEARGADGDTSVTIGFSRLSVDRLAYRVSYMTHRFASSAQYWQFVVWLRQFLLEAMALLPTLLGSSASSLSLEPGKLDEAPIKQWVIWLHSSLALVVIAAFALYHRRVYPYYYEFQNKMEDWLYFASGTMILLGVVYTFLDRKHLLVEVLLLVVLVGSLCGSAAYLTFNYNKGRLEPLHRVQRLGSRLGLDEPLERASSFLSSASSSFARRLRRPSPPPAAKPAASPAPARSTDSSSSHSSHAAPPEEPAAPPPFDSASSLVAFDALKLAVHPPPPAPTESAPSLPSAAAAAPRRSWWRRLRRRPSPPPPPPPAAALPPPSPSRVPHRESFYEPSPRVVELLAALRHPPSLHAAGAAVKILPIDGRVAVRTARARRHAAAARAGSLRARTSLPPSPPPRTSAVPLPSPLPAASAAPALDCPPLRTAAASPPPSAAAVPSTSSASLASPLPTSSASLCSPPRTSAVPSAAAASLSHPPRTSSASLSSPPSTSSASLCSPPRTSAVPSAAAASLSHPPRTSSASLSSPPSTSSASLPPSPNTSAAAQPSSPRRASAAPPPCPPRRATAATPLPPLCRPDSADALEAARPAEAPPSPASPCQLPSLLVAPSASSPRGVGRLPTCDESGEDAAAAAPEASCRSVRALRAEFERRSASPSGRGAAGVAEGPHHLLTRSPSSQENARPVLRHRVSREFVN
ncbi:hypothetical protein AB1Y20_014679 [Prymnesium parvum]|uniref:Uncharacterized protein n=1 Tax=Prymnesium parvum TaxID=97485 RepID=A0AB34ICZ5_PRYPA